MFNFLKKLFGKSTTSAVFSENGAATASENTTAAPDAPISALSTFILKSFRFLETEYGYSIEENTLKPNFQRVLYSKGHRKVYIFLDFTLEKGTFLLLNGMDTSYKKDLDTEYVRDFLWLFNRFEPERSWQSLQPATAGSWESAVALNAALLQRYGEGVLSGEEWF